LFNILAASLGEQLRSLVSGASVAECYNLGAPLRAWFVKHIL